MRILFVSPRQCWPPVSGAKLREYFLARALARRASLTHVFFAAPGEPAPAAADLPFCERVIPVPRPAPYTPAKIARGLSGRWPLPVLNYTSPAMKEALLDACRQPFDAIHLESIHMAAYAPMLSRITGAPVTYDWHNIESEILTRYARSNPSPWRAWYARYTARRMEKLESLILRDGFGHVVCSRREKDELLRRAPGARVAVVENGVDAAGHVPGGAPLSDRRRIVFVGQMSYHANIEAAVHFTRSVWPLVHSRFPEWRLTLVGSDPAPAVLALREASGVEVTGTVPDVRPYYREAVAAIVPLQVGGGTRLKILEAMAAGAPVISTALGAEGLEIAPDENILIAASADDWIRHLRALAGDAALWTRIAQAGRRLVSTRYDWELLGEKLWSAYQQWLEGAARRPA
jgi:glycosyltransferase involved in cell wall biosynthesis